jgi:hypothetical protein
MDINTFTNQSEKIMTVVQTIKNDPNFLNELKADPQEALSKVGIELNEEELDIVQKIGSLSELKEEAEGIFSKVKGFFGFKEGN